MSRSLKTFAEPNRPSDWLSPKNCALQYNSLLEKAGAHKRKRGERHPSSGSTDSLQGNETPGEIILKQLTQGYLNSFSFQSFEIIPTVIVYLVSHPERIEELQQILEESKKEWFSLKKELELVKQGKLDDKLVEMCKKIDE